MSNPSPVMTAAGVKPTSLRIRDLLDSRYPARVPRYQRGYAWTDENVIDLIEDLKRLLAKNPGEAGHFYGGMVAISVPDTSEPRGSYFEVVDGQQRLATFCLLLAELARKADRLQEAAKVAGENEDANKFGIYAKQIRNSYLYFERYDVEKGSEEPEPRLRLSKVDDPVFQALLMGDPPTTERESHQLLVDAVHTLRMELVDKAVDETSFASARQSLLRLQTAVLLDSFIIHIVGDSRASGYRLFAVLNDRGARLTVADLLRSHSLEMLDAYDQLREQAALLWDEILVIGGEDVDRFLGVYHASLVGARPKPQSLFDDVKKLLFREVPMSQAHAHAMYQELYALYESLQHYQDISSGTWPFAVQKGNTQSAVGDWDRSRLSRLVNTVRHDLADPLLLAARFHNDEAGFAELVHIIELFAFRYKNICGAHTAPASSAYYKECRRLRGLPRGSKLDWFELKNLLRVQLEKRASDDIFRSGLRNKLNYQNGSARPNIRELLSLLEDYRGWLKAGAQGSPKPSKLATFDLSEASIEHIHPQNPTVPDPAMADHVHRLGNLSYWSPADNSAAGNDDFLTKQPQYSASQVGLNRDLGKLPGWDLAALERREQELIDEACYLIRL
ncbi:DUF262 domain-containing HNH endonuclease family protein [Micromonospora sp. WMMD980]|uniref:DUF262 domain-containing protein n=1 Tax=Micromonospora sp. WMMD980 TaxID=3016088 RepID=UPI00241645A2|nr:DUF262 domain-containing HNH endonuclease family protein [Micromonospora sp. WMMD980]MDG4803139.1 DUF262 domain-containing HNH endonuclease family protein [Micromonospora sp. WMMD980]